MMTYRERWIRSVRFQPVDELPFRHAYGLMPGVLDDWRAEGLPASVRTERDLYAHFGFPSKSQALPCNLAPIPAFEARVLERTDAGEVAMDVWGRKTRIIFGSSTAPLTIEHPVTDQATWQDYKRRLAFEPSRVGADLEAVAAANVAAGLPNVFGSMGFYWFPRDLLGDEALCAGYYEDPDLVREITGTWCDLVEQTLRAVLARVRLDGVHFGEDMAYKNASMVGPAVFRDFIQPCYARIHALVEQYDVPVFSVDSDGCLHELAAWFREAGVNLIGPNEVQAGNDVLDYRRQFGSTLAYDGGLDKRILLQGRDAIEAMLQRTIPPMRETGGGWCVCLDHRVLKGTPLRDFEFYVQRVRELIR